MFTKQQLIEKLERIIQEEKDAIPFYTKYLNDSFFFRGFASEKINKIKDTMLTLSGDSKQHQEYFESILSEIKQSSKNVY